MAYLLGLRCEILSVCEKKIDDIYPKQQTDLEVVGQEVLLSELNLRIPGSGLLFTPFQ